MQLIGPCVLDDEPETVPDWLATIDRPIVLVTTSSERQADAKLALTAMTALADEPVHVVATLLAGLPDEVESPPNATVCGFVSHGMVLTGRHRPVDAVRVHHREKVVGVV